MALQKQSQARDLPSPNLSLRAAQRSDRENLFQWRNHPAVRQFSLQTNEIPWESHCNWFSATLENPERILLIGEKAGQPIGVLRYDLHQHDALISIYLVPEQMGKGYGTPLLQAGTEWLRQHQPPIQRIIAEIAPKNVASVKAFEKAGYRQVSTHNQQGVLRYEYPF